MQGRLHLPGASAGRVGKLKRKMFIAFGFGILVCAASLAQTVPAPIQTVSEALRNRQYQVALALCSQALEQTPRDYRLFALRGMAYSGLHEQQQALAAYMHALSLSPHYIPALEGAAQIQYQRGSVRAIPLLDELLSVDPENETTHAMLAALYYKQNNCAAAIPHFERSISLVASQPLAYGEYGACMYRSGHYEEAADVFEKVLELKPDDQHMRYDLALAQWMAKRDQSALQTLAPILQSPGPDSQALSLASTIEEADGDTQKAVNLLREAILADPKNIDLYLQFATLSYAHDSYKVGIDILNAGLIQLPKAAELYLARGILYIQSSDYEKGMSDLETANKLDPTLALTNTAEGLLDSQKHDLNQAIRKFRKAIQANPKDAYTHYLLAEVLMSQGHTATNNENHAEERRAAQQAILLDPKLVPARDLLATIDLEYGDIQDAITQSRAALRLDANDQMAVYHLILALRKTNDKSEIPQLVKRLGALKKESETAKSKTKILRLEEQPNETSNGTRN